MWTSLRHSRRSFYSKAGFTLIELLVVVSIMVIITGAILVRQARFDSSTLLRSLAYSVAISVRSAQVYGTSVLGVTSGGTTLFAPAYGVYFNNAASYLLFADLNNNGVYDAASDSIVQTYQVGGGYTISNICSINSTAMYCWVGCPTTLPSGVTSCTNNAIAAATIYFKRPNPDARFTDSGGHTPLTGAYIQMAAINDPTNTRSILVTSTGQISVGTSGS